MDSLTATGAECPSLTVNLADVFIHVFVVFPIVTGPSSTIQLVRVAESASLRASCGGSTVPPWCQHELGANHVIS